MSSRLCQPILSSIKVWSINKKFLHFSPAAKCTPCSYIGTQKTFQLCLGEFFNQTINLICLNNHSLLTLSLSLSLSLSLLSVLCYAGEASEVRVWHYQTRAWPGLGWRGKPGKKWKAFITVDNYHWQIIVTAEYSSTENFNELLTTQCSAAPDTTMV